jgi:hypothetical protein
VRDEENEMNHYDNDNRHRPMIAVAAGLVSAAVLSLAVLAPVYLAPPPDARVLARLQAPIEVAITPSRIDVIGIRTERTAQNEVPVVPASTPAERS